MCLFSTDHTSFWQLPGRSIFFFFCGRGVVSPQQILTVKRQGPDKLSSVRRSVSLSPFRFFLSALTNRRGVRGQGTRTLLEGNARNGRGSGILLPLRLSLNAKFPLDYRPGGRGQKTHATHSAPLCRTRTLSLLHTHTHTHTLHTNTHTR